MKKQSQYLNNIMKAYSNSFGEIGMSIHMKESLKSYRANEAMRKGYEVMAQINLDFCEFGVVDCLTSIDIVEDNLNGDDN